MEQDKVEAEKLKNAMAVALSKPLLELGGIVTYIIEFLVLIFDFMTEKINFGNFHIFLLVQ